MIERSIASGIETYIGQGGFVMPFLAVGAAVLWFCLGYRFIALRRGRCDNMRQLVAHYRSHPDGAARGVLAEAAKQAVSIARHGKTRLAERLEIELGERRDELGRLSTTAQTIVIVAPLAGLLGTVSGMIETFDALADMSLFAQSGGIAGGIAQALITTQMGLAVAIPGLLAGRFLARKQDLLASKLQELQVLLSSEQDSQSVAGRRDA